MKELVSNITKIFNDDLRDLIDGQEERWIINKLDRIKDDVLEEIEKFNKEQSQTKELKHTMNPITHISDLFNTEIEKAIFDQEGKYVIDYLIGLKGDIFEIFYESKMTDLIESNRIEKLIFSKGQTFQQGWDYKFEIFTIVLNPHNTFLTDNIFKSSSKLKCLKLVEEYLAKEELNEV